MRQAVTAGRLARPAAAPPRCGATYRSLLAEPRVRRAIAWSAVGRLPLGTVPLGLLLLTRAQGHSYAQAALVAAAFGIALGLSTPAASAAVDRHGYRRALLPRALAFAAAGAGVCASASAGAPVGVLAAFAALMGVSLPPVTASTRAAWHHLAPAPEAHTLALGLDASMHEIVFVCGPALVALLAGLSTTLVIAFATAAGALGGAGFVIAAGVAGEPVRGGERLAFGAALRSAGLRTLVGAGLLMGVSIGLVEAAMPAFAERHGDRALSGVAVALLAAGAAVGVVGSLRRWGGTSPRRRFLVATCLSPVFMALPLAAGSLLAMDVLMFLAGLPLAAALAAAYALIARLAPSGTQTAAFGWMATALVAGNALGTALAGGLVTLDGPRLPLAAAVVAALASALVPVARLERLDGAAAPPTDLAVAHASAPAATTPRPQEGYQ